MVDPGAIGMNALAAFQMGRAERERQDARKAFASYATNPNEQGLNALAAYDPQFVISERGRLQQQQQQAMMADLQRRAAGGDKAALAELAGIDLGAWDKLADNDRAAAKDRVSAIGQAALAVSQLPPDQRPMAWDGYIDQLSRAYPELAEYRGQYSEQALMGALAQAEQMGKFFELERPSYQVIPEGGVLVNTRDPGAVQQFSGTGPQPGTVVGGYRFRGGNPNDRSSWEPVSGGSGGNAAGGFPANQ